MEKQILKDCINKMFEIAGYDVTFEDVKDRKDNWFWDYTMTEAQELAWRNWCADYIRKKQKLPKYIAKRKADAISFNFGLKINYEKKKMVK